ncbi:NGF domain-containing protein [Nephila pilipes]|uniref:NGF domain-containing protein n=1 Tax=Nephila pilipes TaxID=299642 RepID=A0A8X6TNZ3_NEPPI|nr:NGF domain-containing protein [Nephila pilipes]
MAHRLKFLCQNAAFGLSLIFVLVLSVNSDFLDIEQSLSDQKHTQKRSLTVEEVDLVEVCTSIQSFEQMETAVNVDLLTVEIHPEAWVFATRCRVPGKPCRGFDKLIADENCFEKVGIAVLTSPVQFPIGVAFIRSSAALARISLRNVLSLFEVASTPWLMVG